MSEDTAPRGLHHRLYRWTLRWAAHPKAQLALFLMSLAEASFFPIPPDALLIAMGMSRPRRVFRFALIATAGSVIGGLLGYAIGWGLWQGTSAWVYDNLSPLGFTAENFATVQRMYADNAWLALFSAAFSPIPYKVFTIAAGVFDISMPVFVTASLIGRAGRFFLVAALVGWLGTKAKPWIEKYLGWLTLAFVVLLVLGFVAIRYLA